MSKRRTKSYILRTRVPADMKQAVVDYAADHGEAEAVVLREAIAEYFDNRDIDTGKKSLTTGTRRRRTRRRKR